MVSYEQNDHYTIHLFHYVYSHNMRSVELVIPMSKVDQDQKSDVFSHFSLLKGGIFDNFI